MKKPTILDLFCGSGGSAFGYAQAGFHIVGGDNGDQPDYPFAFHKADALSVSLKGFDAIHASPPCQAMTSMSNRWRGAGGKADSHVNLIAQVRNRLRRAGVPYVIENVPGARNFLKSPIILTGGMFGLRVHRPRLFEVSGFVLPQPERVPAPRDSVGVFGKGHDGRLLWRRKDGTEQHAPKSLDEARVAMAMPWASWRGCAEGVPPPYTRLIGLALMESLGSPS